MNYKSVIKNKKTRLTILNWLRFVPDDVMLRIEYRMAIGRRLNLKTPQTFTEKLQWLKLYNRKDEYSVMVDKYAAKKWISDKVGEQYVVPTLGCWEKYDQIDFSKLPEKFVLKCTHDSGSVIVCDSKSELDYLALKKHFEFHLKNNEYLLGREWPYKNVPRRIIAEPKLDETNGKHGFTVHDYKFFCFNGVPKIMYISNDKGEDPRTDFFDMEFNHLPIHMKDPNSDVTPSKPMQFELMKELSTILSAGVPHLRVDFYVIDGAVYVGELTFFHNSGFVEVKPTEWNLKMGEWIVLPKR